MTTENMKIWMSIVTYSLCSGSLLLVNKVALMYIPSPPLVTALQCIFCVLAILGGSLFFASPHLSPMTRPVVVSYAQYSVLFVLGIYSNMRALESSNVDTVIVFRSAVPLVVALGDWLWMGREAPSLRSLASMIIVVVGCAAFVAVDAEFSVKGWAAYAYVLVYVLCLAAEMLFGKMVTSAHDASLGTSVLLTNSFGFLPFLAIGASTGELRRGLNIEHFTLTASLVLACSCALSAGIGFSSWWCRSLTSATTFTVVGTVNKFITMFLNILIWNKHASALGTCFLVVCLAAGSFYQQAPMRVGQSEYSLISKTALTEKQDSDSEAPVDAGADTIEAKIVS